MKNVVVVGGGNVAMDAARCAKRLNVEDVTIVYEIKKNACKIKKIHHKRRRY